MRTKQKNLLKNIEGNKGQPNRQLLMYQLSIKNALLFLFFIRN